ncbi:MAG: hypothetical protein methR_P2194 [Methyloprofundus sp.]|nr:MAG: hypothetical protein methR_P2194 [Methyloprofundus sp.]
MEQSYILVEGVNIYANVFDTNQLSVIRGSSFLLKRAIEKIETAFCHTNSKQLLAISTGASSGLFVVNSTTSTRQMVQDIVNVLNDPANDFSLLTFIVESCTASSLLQAKEQLLAQLRITQLQSLSLVPDAVQLGNPELAYPDTLEGRRIATQEYREVIQKKPRQLSHSTYRRWQRGQVLKQSYYFSETSKQEKKFKQLDGYAFSNNFEELADNPAYTKLNAKMAVIYMDGNSFSTLQRSMLTGAADQIQAQQEFDCSIQTYRSEFLYAVLKEMISEYPDSRLADALQNDHKTLRFETLLWGGDEMLFVMPAWLGFAFLQYFFDISQTWMMDDKKLTHAAGLVFCNAHTPIKNVRDLAQNLAEKVKETTAEDSINKISGREQNAWSYMVLESIDYPTSSDIDDFNRQHYGDLFSKPTLIPAAKNWQSLQEPLKQLIYDGLLPRRQLYRIVQSISAADKPSDILPHLADNKPWDARLSEQKLTDLTALEQSELQLLEVATDKATLLAVLIQAAGQLFGLNINESNERLCFWVYLYDLWDYLLPEVTQQGEQP